MATASVEAFKTTTDGLLRGRLECRLGVTPDGGSTYTAFGPTAESTFADVASGYAVVESLALAGATTLPAGTYDVRVTCEALNANTNTAGISFSAAGLTVVAVATGA